LHLKTVKKEIQSESVRQPSGPSREVNESASASEFTDVPLSLSHVPPAPDLKPPATQTSLDHNDKAEKDQELLSNTTEIAKKPSCNEEKEHKTPLQDMAPRVEQTSAPVESQQSDPKTLSAKLEPFSVPSIYPAIPSSCSEPQLSEGSYSITYGLLDASFMPVASEGQVAPAVLPLANQESSLPSLVPVEVADVERPRERLYPELPRTCQSVKPFTSEQLRTWEPGSWLENVEILEAEFQSLAHQEGHELYELLLSYWRCRKQLTQAQTELQAANSDCKNVQNRLWSFKDERLSLQGVCADQTKVFGYHCYQEVTLNEAALAELKHLFSAKAEILHQTVALHSYTSILSRLQVESYLYRLLSSNPTTKSVAVQDTSTVSPKSQPSSLQPLKESISVLFIFTRRVLDDSQFQADIHLWLQRLASVLHQVGSTGDHLFILNHLLCCPAGVGKWAVPFLQIKVLDNPSGVYHFMQALAILMSPARHRADFLGHMTPSDVKGNNSLPGPASGNWTLVDEGGEEDEDPETSWMLLSEDDLVSLFSQFPFDELFKHLLGICSEGDYQPQATTSQKMMKIFAFASSLVELLAVGLQTYNRARYRQFVKRIGYMIRMTLCYVSDHWAQYISLTGVSRTTMQEQSFSMEKLQVEFDHLFLRAVLHVLGIWLFMSEMPYGTLSSSMLWKIFYIMQCAEMDGLEKLSCSLSAEDCIQGLREPSHQEKFQHWLSEINSSDGICLLTTFAHMAQPRRTDVDPEFVRKIVLEIYEVAYVSITTREIFSKVGRELLAAIVTAHPHIITVLLERLRETIEKVGMVSLYLFKELPVHLWTPAQAEVGLIRDWLLNFSLTAVENRLACIILEGLNWGFQPNGCLILPASLQSEVALLVIESYQKYLTDKPYGGIFSEGIKQVSYLANVVRLGQTPESSFNQWAWDLVLRLKLHANEISPQDAWCPLPSSSAPSVPEITDSPTMHPVFKAVKAGIPIGCFLAIDMTTIGHSLEKFCSDGISLLKTLVQSRHLKAVVHILENILPLVYHCQYYLLKNEQFLSCMQLFLQLDSGTQGVTQQDFPYILGTYSLYDPTQLLKNVQIVLAPNVYLIVLQAHILESSRPGRVGAVAVLEFWLQVLTEQNLWHRDKAVLYLLDHLCRAAFLHQQEECLQKLIYQQHKRFALISHGLDSGQFSHRRVIISLSVFLFCFKVWFAWLVLNMETMFEEDSQLRRCVEHELLSNPAYTPDQALKKAQVRLKLQVVPSLQRLMIYRWAQQALATPADHPLLPLFWQKFFQLYLRQPGPEFGLEVKGCIGRRYFHGAAHLSLSKSLRQRLVEVSDFHHAASKALKVPCSSSESSDGLLTPGTPITQYMTSPELHTELVLFTVFALWLDDENLQKQEIYLPSLPKQYDTHRLAKIMQRQQEVWMEHVDIERVQHELQEVLSLWSKVKNELALSQNTNFSIFTDFINPLAARERILTHLRKHDAPQGALLLVPVNAPVPDIPTESLADEKIFTALIQEDLAKLQHQAKLATVRETQQVVLDNELLEVLPQLYINREDQLSMQLECRGKGGQPCQGPAHITVKYSRMHKLDPVQNQIQCLKSDIKQLQADGIKAPPQSLAEAAVHTENFITALVNAYKLNPSPGILKVGLTVFYQIVSFVCEDTQRHPPTRQFFTSCIEILGQVFIRDVRSECKQMLKTILLNRHLCNLLSPYFTPNASPAELVSLYEEVVNTLHIDNGDVIFMLLTKFDLTQWLSVTQPQFSERSRLMAIIHQALCTCGLEPEPEVLMPFNIFCKHWTELLLYQFPDHYSDFLRLLMQSSSEQLLSPECWRTSLIVLGCSPHPKIKTNKTRSILLSPQQVDETIEWLSKYFLKLRLSNGDFRSFGLLSKWGPYIEEIKMFWEDLITYVIDLELNNCSKEPVGSPRLVKALESLHAKMAKLFEPWILFLDTDNTSHPHCSPWLESDAAAAVSLVSLYARLMETLHEKFKDRLLPGQRGALWFHLMHYCETCTSPKMPEYLLYTYHTEYSRLPWKDLHPDQTLMNQFFNVERGSPKSCFLFMGELLCEVNWVSVLSDSLSPQLSPSAQTMVVSVLYLMVFLAKEDLSKPESSVLSLLDQSASLPWHLVDFPSYQNVTRYVSTHYPASLVLSHDTSSQHVIRLLRMAAGFGPTTQMLHHKDMTLKCQAFLHLTVQFLTSLDQNGNISLASLETEMEKLLEYIVIFNPPETDLQQRHMATCSLFAEMLTLLNEAGISTAEGLGTKLHSWVEKRARGPLVLPLLTAACRCLASVRHMTRTTEACILSYFTDGGCADQYSGWGPILVSLQVPELTVEDFIQESLNLGSYLTLYVYILQRLNLEQTLLNEKKTLVLLNTWISQVFPSGPADEAKLFLWWHKFLELVQIQVDQEDTSALDTLILTLMAFQNRLAQLGEERLNSGILGAIGLGRKSPLSSSFRVVARSMSTFLLVQVPSENQLRLHPGTELQLPAKAQQALSVLEQMPSNKQYSELHVSVNQAIQFIKYPSHCLCDSNRLLTLLVNALYTDLHYLDIIR
uniref:Ectopic P granules protein 5 homolog n=1 Tax=Sinocyclocheilus anshuiensis TaxID=1608454 RepID=A0A671MCH5_9TELE